VAEHLKARGHEITVLTSTYGATGSPAEPSIERRLRLECDIYHYRPQQALLRYWPDRRSNERAVRELVTRVNPHAIVVWGMWNLSPTVATQLERLAGPRVVYYLANEWPIEPGAHQAYWDGSANSLPGRAFKRLLRHPVRLLLRDEWRPLCLRMEHAIVCSQAVRDGIIAGGTGLRGARVLYHGIDPAPYAAARSLQAGNDRSGSFKVVFVGSLVPHKGTHTAIEAIVRLKDLEDGCCVTLDVLGAGHPDYEARLNRLVDENGLRDRVTFHAPIPRSDLPGFLAQFDALVLPSIWPEPQARISQEAMAAGLVLVGTLTGGTKEILIDGVNGLAFAPDDPDDLAARLRRISADPDLRSALIRAGWQTVNERFTVSRMIDELEAYLTEVRSMAIAGVSGVTAE
jgi:glycosyltransferase involved in cell wall biosynthesis